MGAGPSAQSKRTPSPTPTPTAQPYDVEALSKPENHLVFLNVQSVTQEFLAQHEELCHPILEVALCVTNGNLDVLETGSWVLRHSADHCKLMDTDARFMSKFYGSGEWGNGLFNDCVKATADLDLVQQEMLSLLEKAKTPKGKCPIAGSHPHMLVPILKDWLPNVADFLTTPYPKLVDTSSMVTLGYRWHPAHMQALKHHAGWPTRRALGMVQSQVKMLSWIRQHLFVQPIEQPPTSQKREATAGFKPIPLDF